MIDKHTQTSLYDKNVDMFKKGKCLVERAGTVRRLTHDLGLIRVSSERQGRHMEQKNKQTRKQTNMDFPIPDFENCNLPFTCPTLYRLSYLGLLNVAKESE